MENLDKNERFNDLNEGLEKSGIKYFLISGLYICPNPPLSYYTKTVAFSTYSVLVIFQYLGLMTVKVAWGEMSRVCETLCYVSLLIPMFSGIFIVHIKKTLVEKLFRLIKEDIYKYELPEDTEFSNLALQENLLNLQRVQSYYEYFVMTTLLVWGFISPYLEWHFGDSSANNNPQIMYNLPVPIWVPVNPTNLWANYALYVMQVYTGSMTAICLLAYDIMFICFCFQIITQVKILSHSILNLEMRAVTLFRKNYRSTEVENKDASNILRKLNEDPLFHKCLQSCFRENMLHFEKIEM